MSAPAPSSQAGGLFSGFTRLSKGLAAVLVTGFITSLIAPSSFVYFALIPGKFIPFVWNVLTAGYFETSILGLGVSIASLLVVGKLLEPFWGSKEFFKFIVFVNFFASANTFVLAIFLYFLTRRGDYLYAPISGFHGVLAGFLVAVKQIMPDQEISTFFKLCAKWFSSVFVVLALLSCLFSSEPIQHVPFIVYGTYGAWIYLRYFQRKPEAGFKGDSSAEFSFATFFPGFLQPIITPISTIFENVFCGRRSQMPDEGQDYELGKPLPGSDPVEASRRRERGARALEERLGVASKGETEALPTKSSSKTELDSLESEEMV